jgi:hypothetical protein
MITNQTSAMQSNRPFHLEIWLAIVAVASIAAIAIAVVTGPRFLAAVAAAAFALATMAAGITASSHALQTTPASPRNILKQTTRLSVWTLVWASAALFVAYPIAGLRWQHGWQYASGYAVLAVAFAVYLKGLLGEARDAGATLAKTRRATLLFAVAIVVAAGWLIGSGKLMTKHQDWLANDIFLASAAILLVLSATFLLRTSRP